MKTQEIMTAFVSIDQNLALDTGIGQVTLLNSILVITSLACMLF